MSDKRLQQLVNALLDSEDKNVQSPRNERLITLYSIVDNIIDLSIAEQCQYTENLAKSSPTICISHLEPVHSLTVENSVWVISNPNSKHFKEVIRLVGTGNSSFTGAVLYDKTVHDRGYVNIWTRVVDYDDLFNIALL